MGSGSLVSAGIGLVLVIGALWALFSRLDAIWNGHPAYPTTLLVTAGVGLMLIAFALYPWRPDPEPNGPPWEADEPRPRRRRSGRRVDTAGARGPDRCRRPGRTATRCPRLAAPGPTGRRDVSAKLVHPAEHFGIQHGEPAVVLRRPVAPAGRKIVQLRSSANPAATA